jgi:hypothetical protein
MISFANIMREVLNERMSFRQLLKVSDPARIDRGKHDVNTRSLRVKTMGTNEEWTFSYKSDPSTTGKRHHGYVRFLKESKIMTSKKNADSAMDIHCKVDCNCFAGETLVLMENGTYRPIKDVNIGDKVYTHLGNIKKVTGTISKKVSKSDLVYKIKVTGFPSELIVTGDHPFLALRGNDYCLCGCGYPIWKSSFLHKCSSPSLILEKKYQRGHYKRCQKIKDQSDGKFKWVAVKDLRPHEWFLSPWLTSKFNDIDVDPDFARLVGYYIAEGCVVHKNKGTTIRLTFNINEIDTLGQDVMDICKKLGYVASIFKSNHGNWFDIRINDREFKKYCVLNVGCGSKNKKLSQNIMNWNINCIRQLFVGAVLGDGWIDPKKGIKYFSISFDLISQFSTMLNKIGIRHTISIFQSNKNEVEKNIVYQLVIPRGVDATTIQNWLFPFLRDKDKFKLSTNNIKALIHNREEGCLKSLRTHEKIDYDGLVYDITVEEDESFIAHGIAVHNCPDYRYRWAYRNAEQDAGMLGPDSINGNNGQPPKTKNTDLGPGLCKHLSSLTEYLRTKLDPVAPENPDEVPQEPEPTPEPVQPSVASTPSKLGKAPEQPSPYSDSRAGDLFESTDSIYNKIDRFVKETPEFEVQYED